MRRFLWAALAILWIVPAYGEDFKTGDITVIQPWARATPGASTAGVIYLEIRNAGAAPDRLMKIETPAAQSAEVHSMEMQNGMMMMQPEGPLDLDAGKSIVLKPGGMHIMLMNLVKPLKAGDAFQATLTFEHAGPVTVTVPVEKAGATAPSTSAPSN
jgi:copper(I)-binding protein